MENEETFSSQERQRAASSAAQKRIAAAPSQTSQSVRILVYPFAFSGLFLLSSLRQHPLTSEKKKLKKFFQNFQNRNSKIQQKIIRSNPFIEDQIERIYQKEKLKQRRNDSFCFKSRRTCDYARKKLQEAKNTTQLPLAARM